MGEAPGWMAAAAKAGGAQAFVHVSAIVPDAHEGNRYAEAKRMGEERVLAAFPSATILRPSMLFGPGGGVTELFAPLIGAMGAFIAGSNTISNMMFSLFQFSTAEQIGLGAAGAATVVALQAIGGAAGNMICVHNVVAASATVGLVDREGEIIRMTLIPMTYYIVQGGLIGLALLSGGFSMWWIAAMIWGAAVLFVMSRSRGRHLN